VSPNGCAVGHPHPLDNHPDGRRGKLRPVRGALRQRQGQAVRCVPIPLPRSRDREQLVAKAGYSRAGWVLTCARAGVSRWSGGQGQPSSDDCPLPVKEARQLPHSARCTSKVGQGAHRPLYRASGPDYHCQRVKGEPSRSRHARSLTNFPSLRRILCSQFLALIFSVRKRAKPARGFVIGWGPDNLRDSGKLARPCPLRQLPALPPYIPARGLTRCSARIIQFVAANPTRSGGQF